MTRSMPRFWNSWAAGSVISSFISTIVSPVSGLTTRSRATRPTMRSMNGSMISPFSTMAETLSPLRVPQSCSSMMTSWQTSTSLRVR